MKKKQTSIVLILILIMVLFYFGQTLQIFDVQANMGFSLPNRAEISGSNINYVGPSSITGVKVDAYPGRANVPYEYCGLIGTPSCGDKDNCEVTYRGCNFDAVIFLSNFEVSSLYCLESNVWDGSKHINVECPSDWYNKVSCSGGSGSITCNFPPPHGYGGEDGSSMSVTITFTKRGLTTECSSNQDCMWCGQACMKKQEMICPTVIPPQGYSCECIGNGCHITEDKTDNSMLIILALFGSLTFIFIKEKKWLK